MKVYWRQFEELVIGFVHKYRYDPFFRTEVNVVGLQILFALFLLAVVGIIAIQLYRDASTAVTQGISDALTPHSTPASIGSSIIDTLEYTRSRTLLLAACAIISVTALFTYVIARLALSPTRNALQSQKQFIGNVAHELRTPLSISKTNIEVALMSGSITDDLKKSLESTVEEMDRMSGIINNLLSLSAFMRLEQIEFHDVDIGLIVQSALQKLQRLAQPKHLEIEMRMSEWRQVWGNAIALEQIIFNVIKNAILYTPNRGRVVMSVEPVYPDFIEIRVRDSGIGIARRDLYRIFEPYYRADPSRKRGHGGSGLGLTIVSELVRLHRGKIMVRSTEGRGTIVTILLPASKSKKDEMHTFAQRARDTASEIAVDFSHHQHVDA